MKKKALWEVYSKLLQLLTFQTAHERATGGIPCHTVGPHSLFKTPGPPCHMPWDGECGRQAQGASVLSLHVLKEVLWDRVGKT